jgi:hypothetical protein
MTRKPSNAGRRQPRRARPGLEGLEDRRVMSSGSASSAGVFAHLDRVFTYTTPTGGHASIQVVGRGSLTGTTVDSAGALHLAFGETNAFTKLVGNVHGGNGRAPLASIRYNQISGGGGQLNLTGVGSTVLAAVYLRDFDLVAGGNINLTAGVNTLVLDSVGPGTQIHLRALPPAPTPTTTTLTTSQPVKVTTTSGSTGSVITGATTTGGATSSTLEAGQSATITSNGVSATYTSAKNLSQSLTAVSGVFTAGTNVIEPLATGQPPSLPPAPPGVIFKTNTIKGDLAGPLNLLTDSKIFGYDPMTGQVVRFNLNLVTDTGTLDPTFAPINVPGALAVAGLNLGRNGNQLDILVSSGTTVYAYNATTGAPVGSFTTSSAVNSIGSTDNLTVLGSFTPNQLEMINLTASLKTGVAQPQGSAKPYLPTAGFTLLGGLTGLPATNNLYATVAATFNTFQPNLTQLGIQTVGTGKSVPVSGDGTTFSNQFSNGSSTPLLQMGAFFNVPNNQPGPALGSIDQQLAVVASAANGTNTVNLYTPGSSVSSGSITLNYADPLAALSQSFRPDLTGSALVDIQGNVQSIRGQEANGLVLNDSGNLNLIKFANIANSTIVGQPVSHVQITRRSHVTILTPSRTVDGRNGVTVNQSLKQIGPLSQPND